MGRHDPKTCLKPRRRRLRGFFSFNFRLDMIDPLVGSPGRSTLTGTPLKSPPPHEHTPNEQNISFRDVRLFGVRTGPNKPNMFGNVRVRSNVPATRPCTHKSRLVSSGWSLSALPPKADIRQRIEHVCFVPIATFARLGRNGAMSPASPLVRDRGRSGRGLQGLERSAPAATLAA